LPIAGARTRPGPLRTYAGQVTEMSRIWIREGIVDPDALHGLPVWLDPIVSCVQSIHSDDLKYAVPTDGEGRHSAVLILFGEGPDPDLLMIQRAARMRAHAGQPAFPGGAVDEGDADARAAALREAVEETGLAAEGVRVIGQLPDLWLSVSGFVVTPVIAWWEEPSEVWAREPDEVESVTRVRLADLLDPGNRVNVRHPSGYVGPGFRVNDMLVWGFTGGLIDLILDHSGLALPWDSSVMVDLDIVSALDDQNVTS
jgi:8-oxo-dGTP pyrophosphatase MutT (NUDIX family)